MSKGNLFLGFGRGSVGDVVFSHIDGEQVARARNRSPRNPQTPIQLLQRVCLKTTSSAYSLLQDICNHSFQGLAEGTMSQAAFNKLNIDRVRTQLTFEINSGDPDDILNSGESNFAFKSSSGCEINPYIVSDGKLTSIPVGWLSQLSTPQFGIAVSVGSATPTYQNIIDALGLVRGDQLTFLLLSVNDTADGGVFNGFEYSRVILDPSDGDMSGAFLSGSAIANPNEKNQGNFTFSVVSQGANYYLVFNCPKFTAAAGNQYSLAAATVISSRLSGNVWARSRQQLVVRSYLSSVAGHLTFDHGTDYLGDAVASYMTGDSSSLYLNQAGVDSNIVLPAGPALFGNVSLNGSTLDAGSPNQGSSPATIVAAKTGGDAGKTYKLGIYTYSGGQPGTSVAEATFSGASATISNQALTNGAYICVLLENGTIVDTSPYFFIES